MLKLTAPPKFIEGAKYRILPGSVERSTDLKTHSPSMRRYPERKRNGHLVSIWVTALYESPAVCLPVRALCGLDWTAAGAIMEPPSAGYYDDHRYVL